MGTERCERERLIRDHLPLVHAVARGFRSRGEDWDDLVQAGMVGLVHAANRFEPERGRPFAAYATPCVSGEIRRHLRDRACVVRVPRREQAERMWARRAAAEGPGAPPAARAGLSAEEVARVRARDGDPVEWTDARVGGAPDDELARADDRMAIAAALRRLDARARLVVTRRFFDDRRQSEIATELGISQVQVSRILQRGLERLRTELDDRVVARPRPTT